MKTLELRYADHHGKSYCWTPDLFLESTCISEINHREVIGKMMLVLHGAGILSEFCVTLRSQDAVPDWVLSFMESKND